MAAEATGKFRHEELLGYLYMLSIAGNETTTKLIGNIVYQLTGIPISDASCSPTARSHRWS